MADLGSKSALKISIDNKVFTNTNYEVSAEDIRSSFEDTIDTLKLGIVAMASYADLKTLVTNSRLEPGMWYSFPYETKHVIPETTILNTASTGYSPITETLMIQAKTTSTFFHQAKSLNYPSDDILYDFTLDSAQSPNDRPGYIYYRHNKVSDIEAWFDVRNRVVVRYPLDLSGIAYVSGAVSRGNTVKDTVAGLLKISLKSGTSDINDFRKLEDINIIDSTLYSKNDTVDFSSTSIPVSSSGASYSQSIVNSTNVHLAIGCDNILINGCTSVVANRNTVSQATIVNSSNVEMGSSNAQIVISGCSMVDLGDNNSDVYLFSSNRVKLGSNVTTSLIVSSNDTAVGGGTIGVFIKSSNGNSIGSNCTSLMMNRTSSNNIISQNCSGITLGNSVSNVFDPGCSDIQIFSGGENKFGAGCDTINLLGELDSAFTGGGYYSPYSEMLRNSFGVGCSNITFDTLGGRGNQFGDECRNLLFTSAGLGYRVIGCSFARGIQNKTFEDIVHGCSFIVPCQVTATITSAKWYAQAIWLNADDTVGTVKERTWQENNVSSAGNLMIGYQQTGTTFFGSTAKNSDGTTASGFRVQSNMPTGHAFIWTTDGYPLSSTLTAGLTKAGDPTTSLNR
jgi:hypothetical protein